MTLTFLKHFLHFNLEAIKVGCSLFRKAETYSSLDHTLIRLLLLNFFSLFVLHKCSSHENWQISLNKNILNFDGLLIGTSIIGSLFISSSFLVPALFCVPKCQTRTQWNACVKKSQEGEGCVRVVSYCWSWRLCGNPQYSKKGKIVQ